jgi:hypothetical protein
MQENLASWHWRIVRPSDIAVVHISSGPISYSDPLTRSDNA